MKKLLPQFLSFPIPGMIATAKKSFATVSLFWLIIILLANQASAQKIQPGALRQIQSLMDEKASRTPAQKKINSQILYEFKMRNGKALTAELQTIQTSVVKDSRGKIKVDMDADVTVQLLDQLKALGCEIIFSSEQFKNVVAQVPLDKVEQIASLDAVKHINEWIAPINNSNLSGQLNNYKKLRAGDFDRVKSPLKRNDEPLFNNRYHPAFANRAANIREEFGSVLNKMMFGEKSFPSGSVTSEGDATHKANVARTAFATNGSGVKIGVISDSYDTRTTGTNASDDIASGDLPGPGNPNGFTTPVTVLSDYTGTVVNPSGDEGRAMLQIIHDLAPGAQLYFATAEISQASFAQQILDLRAAGCDIIVDDINYFAEGVFQDDNVAQAINTVTASGALYFSSAGNSGSKDDNTAGVWEGDFVDGGISTVPLPLTGNLHDFGGAVLFNTVTATTGLLTLKWSDPLGLSGNDYDLFVTNSSGTSIVRSSTNVQDGNDNPYEQVSGASVGQRIYILKKTGAAVRALHLNSNRGQLSISTPGVMYGHNAAASAYTVAATPAAVASSTAGSSTGPFPGTFNTANKVELFSSDGPRRIFFNPNGSEITPGNVLFGTNGGTVLQKPDITAADGVVTTLPGNSGLNPFFGTSAAAPHAAAIAALIKSKFPLASPPKIRTALISTAIDIEAPGVDRNAGAGIVMAYEALQAATALMADCPTITVTNPAISSGRLNAAFSQSFSQAGGVGTILFSTPNPLPAGLTLSPGGVLSGVPTQLGTFPITVTATDVNDCAGRSTTYNLEITTVIINASAPVVITAENAVPANNAPDPGETLTVNLPLINTGSANTTNLVATLQASGGVTSPGGPQTYGVVTAGGAAVARPFTFKAVGNCGDNIVLTLSLQDGANNLGTITYTLKLGADGPSSTVTFSNPAVMNIPDYGAATPYPSNITVSGVSGAISTVTVKLKQFSHAYVADLDMLLVSPTGQKMVILSGVADGYAVNNITLTLADAAAGLIPNGPVATGSYRPTSNYNSFSFGASTPAEPYLIPAPAGSATLTSAFSGQNPNGTWSLYVSDAEDPDAGAINGGWELSISTSSGVCSVVPNFLTIDNVTHNEGNSGPTTYSYTVSLSSPAPAGGVTFDIATADNTATIANNDYAAKSLTGQTIPAGSSTYTFDVTVNGDFANEPDETFFVNVTNVTGATISDGQGLGTITNDDLPCSSYTNNRIYVNAAANGAGNGTTWADAFTDLQTALAATTPCSAITEIWVAAGTYKPTTTTDRNISFVMKNNLAIYGGFTGTETSLSDRNAVTNVTILSGDIGAAGNADNSYNVVKNLGNGLNSTAILDGFTITAGNANGGTIVPTSPLNCGGGMYNSQSSPSITGCTFQNNAALGSAGTGGGGMFNYNNASPTITNCSFINNTASTGGGGLHNNSGCSPVLSNCVFTGNTSSGSGGAINNYSSSNPNITKSRFFGNSATVSGGAVYNNFASLSFTNCVFSGNNGGANGGAIFQNDALLTLINSSFSGNLATSGAAIKTIADLSVIATGIVNSIFWGDGGTEIVTSNTGFGNAVANVTYSIVQGGFAGTGNLNVDPLFVSASDLHLQPASPAINAGTNTGAPATDIDGTTRPLTVANPADMGAYEAPIVVPVVSINDITHSEGNSGTTTWSFTVSLSSPAPAGGVAFDIATANGTATTADNDYAAKSLTAQIPAGSSSYTFDVTVNGDNTVEPDETFFVNVTNVTGATVADAQGLGTITNDDATIATSLTLASATNPSCVGNVATFNATLTRVTAPAGPLAGQLVTFSFNGPTSLSYSAITDAIGTATVQVNLVIAGSYTVTANFINTGYDPASDVLTHVVSAIPATPTVTPGGPTTFCAGGSVTLSSSSATGNQWYLNSNLISGAIDQTYSATASGTYTVIVTAGCSSSPSAGTTVNANNCITINNVTQTEGNAGTTNFTFTVSLSSPAGAGGVTFDIATANNTATTANNDYAAKSLTAQTIPAGSSSYKFDVTVNGDNTVEPDETFFVNITDVTGATVSDGQGIGTITNDDAVTPTSLALASNTNPSCVGNVATFKATLTRTSAPVGPLAGQTVTFTFNGPTSLSYSAITDAMGTATVQVNLVIAGSYTVTANFINTGYDPASDVLTHVVSAIPATPTVTPGGPTTFCAGGSVTLSSSSATGNQWYLNSNLISGAIDQTYSATASGIYTVTVTSGCSSFPSAGTMVTANNCMTINNVTQTEGNAGTTNFTFTVSLSSPAGAGGVTFDIATANNTATTANNDYAAKSLTAQTIPAGSSTYTFDVAVKGDVTFEPDETFFVNVTNVTGATVSDGQGVGTITNDDADGPVASVLSVNGSSSICTGTSANLAVTITGGIPLYIVVYQDDHNNQFTVSNYTSGSNIPVSPTGNTTYSLVSVTDAGSNPGTGNSGTAVIIVKPTPNAVATPAMQTVCSGTPLTSIALTGSVSGTVYNWASDMPATVTGIATSGSGDIGGTLTNISASPATVTYTITPTANGCNGSPIQATVTVNPLPSATISGTTIACQNSGQPTISFTGSGGKAPYTFSYSLSDGSTTTTATTSGTVAAATTAAGIFTYTLISVQDAGSLSCGQNISGQTAVVTVKATPTATATPTAQTVCSGTPISTIVLSGSTGYNWTSDMPASVTGIAVSGTTDISGTLTNSTASAVTVTYTVTPTSSGCDASPVQVTVTVKPLPTATINGTAVVCQNAVPPAISFVASGGSAPYVFSYSLSDGTNTSSGTSSGTVAAPTSIPGTFTYTLLSVQSSGSPACAQNITDQTAVVTVNPLPDAAIVADNIVTAVSTNNIASVPDAGTGATYVWGITNGTITAGAGTKKITYKAGAAGTVTLTVTLTSGSNCGPVNGNKQVTITPLPCPNVSVTVASAVCTLSTGNIASVADAGTGATYVWTITGGTTTAGAGTKSIIYKAGGASFYPDCLKISVKVTNASGVCTVTSGTYKVLVSALPNAAIAASAAVCTSSAGNTASVYNCGAGAAYVWTITNGTITAGAGSNKITYKAGTSGSVTLSVMVTNPTGCNAYGSKLIGIASYPTATITAAASVCAGSTGNAASVANAGSGAKYAWTINNGTITTGFGTSNITYTAGTSGAVTLTVKVTNSGGCSISSSKLVATSAAPNAAITATSPVCAGSTNTASVISGAARYLWTITNGNIILGNGTNIIKYTAGTSGTVKLSVTVTNSAGCKATGSKSVTITTAPNATITAASSVCRGSTANIASVVSAGSGATYTWAISSGSSITSGIGTTSIKYTAAASGSVTLNVTVKNSAGCSTPGSKTVTVISKIIPLFATIGPLCQGAKAPSLPAVSSNGISGTWSPSKISTSAVGTITYTFTPATGQCAAASTMNIIVQRCNAAAGVMNVAETAPAMDAALLPNPTHNQFTLVIKGNRKEIAKIRVFDILGQPIELLQASTGAAVKFGMSYINGIYIVEVMQGTDRKLFKAVKQ